MACAATAGATTPEYAQVRAAHRPSDLLLLDRRGEPLQMLRTDPQVRRAAWVPLAELSPALREAIVLGEDRRFWEHSGVDWRALAAGAFAQAWNRRTRGASTVTMQLAGMLDADLARPAGGRSAVTKVQQIAAAAAIERRWSKAEILEAYLNLVPMRGELVGVPAAAQQLFGKQASGLDRPEAALLAALVRAPNADEATLVRRGCELMRAMQGECTGLALIAAQALARRPGAAPGPQLAPHYARAWVAAGGAAGTPLDARLQRLALRALRQQLAELRGRNVEDGAVLVLHNASGEVRAWVGSAGSDGGDVDAVLARRQPGSTVKPFVYAQAFQQRLITPQSWLADEPVQLASGRDAYQPQNHDHAWRGWVPARIALASSLNVPAVRVGAMLGPDAMFDAMQRSGLRLRESAGFHGHALALGSAEVTLLDLTNGYRMLANRGQASALSWPSGQRAARPVAAFDAVTAAAVTSILADTAARAPGFGFDNPLATRRPAAVKTGTSKDMRDNWCIGYNDTYTVGVWIGNRGGAPMHGISGVQGAAPVWRAVMEALPAGLTRALEGAPSTWLEARAGPASTSPRPFRIGPLQDGAVLAMDPDIPLARQRLSLHGPAGTWSVDGRPYGRGERIEWPLAPGRHVVELWDGARLIDRVRFEVRPGIGPGPAPAGPRRGQAGVPPRPSSRSMAASITTPQTL
ncbi:MAG: penicillin-binding protein 1C [Rubrivivax sp.]|nr:penicillin-binding protein 1C [Rubrivivax sp.]